jgi:hypothetical protein
MISAYKETVREPYIRPVVHVCPVSLSLSLFLARFPLSNNWLFVDIFGTGTELDGGKVRSKVDNGACYRVFVKNAKFLLKNTDSLI